MSGGCGSSLPTSSGDPEVRVGLACIAVVALVAVAVFGSIFWRIADQARRDAPRVAAWRVVYDRAQIAGYCGAATIYRDPANDRLVRFGVLQGDYEYFPAGSTLQGVCPSPVPEAQTGGLDMNSAMLGAMAAGALR